MLDAEGRKFGDARDGRQPMCLQEPLAIMRNSAFLEKVHDCMETLGWKPYEVGGFMGGWGGLWVGGRWVGGLWGGWSVGWVIGGWVGGWAGCGVGALLGGCAARWVGL